MSRNIKEEVVENTPKKAQDRKRQVKSEVVEDSPSNSNEINTPSTFSPAWQNPVHFDMSPSVMSGFPTPPFPHHHYGGFNSPSFSSPECSPSSNVAPYSRNAGRTPTKTRKARVSKKAMDEKIRIVDEVYWRTYNDYMYQNWFSLQPSSYSPTNGPELFGEPYKPTHCHPSWFKEH